MITKILFTLLVIIIVALAFRGKAAKQPPASIQVSEQAGSLSVRTVAYIIIAALLLIASAIFVFNYQADNRIIDIRVIAKGGSSALYQARQKDIRGRRFTTLDHRQVTLGESDRIEMTQP